MKLKTHKSLRKDRPLRVYKNIKNRKKYIRKTRNGKKLYIKTKGNMTNSNMVKVVVHNHVARHPTTKTPSSKKKSAFTQKLDKTHTPIANTPYHQVPPPAVVVVPSKTNDNDNKHAGEIARLRRQYTELETKHKETTPPIKLEHVKTEKTDEAGEKEDNGQAEEKDAEPPPPPQNTHHHFDEEGEIIDDLPDALPMNQRKIGFHALNFQQLIRIAKGKGVEHQGLKPDKLQRDLKAYATQHGMKYVELLHYYYNELRGRGADNTASDNAGMTTSEIADFLEIKTHHIVPVIAKDQMDLLLPFVNRDTKQFYFVINSDPISKAGTHWRAGGIDMDDGSCYFYDPLANDCDMSFQKGMKELIDKINPHFYLKFKINKIKDQSSKSANCGDFCCKWVDAMWSGKPFKEATKYNAINGEKDIEKYKMKWNLI